MEPLSPSCQQSARLRRADLFWHALALSGLPCPKEVECAVCLRTTLSELWVQCNRCRARFHTGCFRLCARCPLCRAERREVVAHRAPLTGHCASSHMHLHEEIDEWAQRCPS